LRHGHHRRDFLKYSGATGSVALLEWNGGTAMASSKSRVAFLKAEDRAAAVAETSMRWE